MDNLISKDTVEEIIRKYAKKVNDGEVIVNADVPTTIGALLFDLNNEIGFTPSVDIPSAEPCDVFDEYGNYKYPSDVELTEPNTATSMPSGDLISRQAAIKSIEKRAKQIKNEDTLNGLAGAVAILFELPSVKPQEPKTGYWTERKIHEATGFFLPTCSECGQIQPCTRHTFRWNYCPNCGARMVEPQESEERKMTCDECKYFKIIQEPLRTEGTIFDFGRVRCEKHNLISDFCSISHKEFEQLDTCDDFEPQERSE